MKCVTVLTGNNPTNAHAGAVAGVYAYSTVPGAVSLPWAIHYCVLCIARTIVVLMLQVKSNSNKESFLSEYRRRLIPEVPSQVPRKRLMGGSQIRTFLSRSRFLVFSYRYLADILLGGGRFPLWWRDLEVLKLAIILFLDLFSLVLILRARLIYFWNTSILIFVR